MKNTLRSQIRKFGRTRGRVLLLAIGAAGLLATIVSLGIAIHLEASLFDLAQSKRFVLIIGILGTAVFLYTSSAMWIYLIHFPESVLRYFEKVVQFDPSVIDERIIEKLRSRDYSYRSICIELKNPHLPDNPQTETLRKAELQKWIWIDRIYMILIHFFSSHAILSLIILFFLLKSIFHGIHC